MKNHFTSLKFILSRETGFVCKKTSPKNPCEILSSTVNSILPVGFPESNKIIFRCIASDRALSFFCLSSMLNPYKQGCSSSDRRYTRSATAKVLLRASVIPCRLRAAISRRSRCRIESRPCSKPSWPSSRMNSGVSWARDGFCEIRRVSSRIGIHIGKSAIYTPPVCFGCGAFGAGCPGFLTSPGPPWGCINTCFS